MASIFTLKRVPRHVPKRGQITRNVWVLSENGREIIVDKSLAFIVRCIAAGRHGGAQ